MGRHVVEDFHLPRFPVHLHLDAVGSIGIGLGKVPFELPVQILVVRVIKILGHDHGAVFLVVGAPQDLAEGDFLFRFFDRIDHPVFDHKVVRILIQLHFVPGPVLVLPPVHEPRSKLEDSFFHPPCSHDGRVAGHKGGPACMDAHIPGANIRVAVQNVYILRTNAHLLGHQLGDDRLRALADVRGPCEYIHISKVIHLHDRSTAVRFVNPGAAAHMDEGCHADAPARFPLPLFLVRPVQSLAHLLDALLEAATGHLEALGCHLPGLIGVHHPEFEGVPA